jgi:hypothetical protein
MAAYSATYDILSVLGQAEGALIMPSSLSMESNLNIPAPMLLSGIANILNELGQQLKGEYTIVNILGFGLSASLEVPVVLSQAEGSLSIITELSGGLRGVLAIRTTLGDFAYSGQKEMLTELGNRMSDTLKIRSAIGGTDSLMQVHDVLITVDGEDITGIVSRADLNIFGNAVIADVTLELASERTFETGDIIRINIDGVVYEYILEEHQTEKNSVKVWGRAMSAKLYEPYAKKKDVAFNGGMAGELAESISGSVVWLGDDYKIEPFSVSDYPLNIVQLCADAGGLDIRALDSIYIVSPAEVSEYLTTEHIFEAKTASAANSYDAVSIDTGTGDILLVEPEKTEADLTEKVSVRIYSTSDYQFNADAYTKLKTKKIREKVTEEVQFSEGEGTLKYPLVKMISDITAFGQNVYCDGCRYLTVEYETEYDLWEVWSDKEVRAMLCVAANESIVTVGMGERVYETSDSLVRDKDTAEFLAKNLLLANSGVTTTFKVLHSSDFVNPSPTGFRYRDIKGAIIGASIQIESSPLRVYDTLEVRSWQAVHQ